MAMPGMTDTSQPASQPGSGTASQPGAQPAGISAAPVVESQPAAALPTQPLATGPTRTMPAQSWGSRVYHGVLDALGGTNDVSLARDPQTGKMVATAVRSGPGSQWKRIIGGALTGLAAADSAGPGPAGGARGFGAGFGAVEQQQQRRQQQQRQNANEDFQMQQKAATSQAQNALLSHQIAKSTFELERDKVNAAASDTQRENDFASVIAAGGEGSTDMGVFPDFASVIKAFQEVPALHDHQAGGRIITIPHVNEQGKIDGVRAALVTPDWLSSKINQDLPVTVRSYKDGKMQEDTYTIPAGSLTGDEYSKMVMAQSRDALQQYTADRNADLSRQRVELTAERNQHLNAASDATARHENAETQTLGANGGIKGLAAGEDPNTIVDGIGTGKINPGRMSYLLARNPGLVQQVTAKYPNFDTSKVESYANTYKEYTSMKPNSAGWSIHSGATAFEHLQELMALNTPASHIPHTPAWTAYQNKVSTLSSELAKFYGNDTIPGIRSYEETLGSTLPGNRESAIRTQIQSMGDRMDNYEQAWRDANPSPSYAPPMPQISDAAKAARASLDPRYAQRLAAALPQQARAALKEGVNTTFGNGQTWTLRNGQPMLVGGR